jgi:hypothetical protein
MPVGALAYAHDVSSRLRREFLGFNNRDNVYYVN